MSNLGPCLRRGSNNSGRNCPNCCCPFEHDICLMTADGNLTQAAGMVWPGEQSIPRAGLAGRVEHLAWTPWPLQEGTAHLIHRDGGGDSPHNHTISNFFQRLPCVVTTPLIFLLRYVGNTYEALLAEIASLW